VTPLVPKPVSWILRARRSDTGRGSHPDLPAPEGGLLGTSLRRWAHRSCKPFRLDLIAVDSVCTLSIVVTPSAAPVQSLFDPRVVIFVGKGGVGKTTSAAAYALDRSREERVLLLSIDPAHSLGDLFPDVSSCGGDPREVDTGDRAGHGGRLAVETLDADEKTDAFRSRHAETIREIVRRGTFFEDKDIARVLQMSLPGMDEVMAFLRLAELLDLSGEGPSVAVTSSNDADVSEGALHIDRVVVDTAPTGHTLRFFDMPGRFTSWLDVLDRMLDKHRTMRAVFGTGAPDPLDAFLNEMYASADRVSEALQDPSMVRAAVVARAEPLVQAETERLLDALADRGIAVGAVILNARSEPVGEPLDLTFSEHGLESQDPSLETPLETSKKTEREVTRSPAGIPGPVLRGEVPGYGLPHESALTSQDARDRVAALKTAWTRLYELSDQGGTTAGTAVEVSGNEGTLRWTVENPAPLPEARVVMVAGKGGVGKTTIACATALRLAASVRRLSNAPEAGRRPSFDPSRRASDARLRVPPRVLLASTDPAHSLVDVFGVERSDAHLSSPTRVAPRLDVLEIDAASRFSLLRERYRDEVRAAFDDVGGRHVDLPFDRAVTESMLDLAPPGIDEVMGWVAVMEFVRRDEYHACVIDTAPTGHFRQLVDMPSRFAEWTRAIFRILRSHRDVLRMPTVTDRLVRLSKQTKRWRQMQANGQIQVVTVTRPEPVVQSETLRLAQYLRDRSLQVHSAVMNAVTPPADRTSAEQDLIDTFRSTLHGRSNDGTPDGETVDHEGTDHGASDHGASDHGASDHGASDHRANGDALDGMAPRRDRPVPVSLVYRHPGPRPTTSLSQLGRVLYT